MTAMKTLTTSPTTHRVVRRVVLRTLAEVIPPLAITSLGRGMVLVGQGLELIGQLLQSSGDRVEQFGHEQALRNMSPWVPRVPNPTPPAPDSNTPATSVATP